MKYYFEEEQNRFVCDPESKHEEGFVEVKLLKSKEFLEKALPGAYEEDLEDIDITYENLYGVVEDDPEPILELEECIPVKIMVCSDVHSRVFIELVNAWVSLSKRPGIYVEMKLLC